MVKWYFISFLLPFVKGCTGLTKYGHKGRDANNSLKLGAIPKSGGKAIKGGMGNVWKGKIAFWKKINKSC